MSATCQSCAAPIVWAMTDRGRRMPVDVEPVDDGNLVLVWRGDVLTVAVVGHEDRRPRHRAHFATCPDAASWRRNRKEQVE